MQEKYRTFRNTTVSDLYQCYANPSPAKVQAYFDHLERLRECRPVSIRILGHNSQTFSMGVIGFHPENGRKIFIYITPTKTRYTYVE